MEKPTHVVIIGSNQYCYDLFVYFGLKAYSLEVFVRSSSFEPGGESLFLDLSQYQPAEWESEVTKFVLNQEFSYLLPFLVRQDDT